VTWFVVLIAVAVLAGVFIPDGLLWFTALCLSIPALTTRSHYHGALVDCLLAGFVNPILWVYFLVNFTAICIAYVIFVRFGMIMRKASAALPHRLERTNIALGRLPLGIPVDSRPRGDDRLVYYLPWMSKRPWTASQP
jgi:hypothetical protein